MLRKAYLGGVVPGFCQLNSDDWFHNQLVLLLTHGRLLRASRQLSGNDFQRPGHPLILLKEEIKIADRCEMNLHSP